MNSFKTGDIVATNSQPDRPMDVIAVNEGKVMCRWVERGKTCEEELPIEILQKYTKPKPVIRSGKLRAGDEIERRFRRMG